MFLSMLSSCGFVLESGSMHQDSTNKPPNLLDHLDEALPVVKGARLGIVLDFDGTISELAPTPDESRISAESAEALERVAGIVAGRASRQQFHSSRHNYMIIANPASCAMVSPSRGSIDTTIAGP